MEQIISSSQVFVSLVKSNIVYFSLIQSNEIDGANYKVDGVKYEIDGVNHVEINGANHDKQSSTLQSIQAKYSLFQSSSLIDSSLVMKELFGWSLDGALDPWSCFFCKNKIIQLKYCETERGRD